MLDANFPTFIFLKDHLPARSSAWVATLVNRAHLIGRHAREFWLQFPAVSEKNDGHVHLRAYHPTVMGLFYVVPGA
jgi:hypothetical protein